MVFWNYNFNCKGGVPIKALSIRFSDKLHKAIKLKTVTDGLTIQNYIINLIKKDLNFTDIDDDLSDYQTKK